MTNNGYGNLTHKQDRFARFLFDGLSQREAWIKAGYSHKYAMAYVDTHASVLANTDKVKKRFQELKDAADAESVMNYQERQKVLTAIGRQPAFPKVQRNVISSIDTLNKMDRIYTEGATVNIDNRKVEITVVYGKDKKPPSEIRDGDSNEA